MIMDVARLLSFGIRVSIFLMVLATGMAGQRGEARALFRRPALLVRSIVAMQVLAPLLAVGLTFLLPIERAVKIALVTLAVSPVPPFLPRRMLKAGGPRGYVVSLLATSALLSVVSIPMTLSLISDVTGVELTLPLAALARQLVMTVLLPLLLGLLIARVLPAIAASWAAPVGSGAALVLALSVLPLIVRTFPAMRTLAGDGTLLVMTLYAAGALLIGHLLGGPEQGNRTVLALSTAARHPGIAILLATTNFAADRLATPAVLMLVIVSFVATIPYLALTRRRPLVPVVAPAHR
jgi:BASS family bile acid:Na+ symporter